MRSLRLAYGKTLLELGHKHSEILVFDADLSSSTQTILFQKEFPDRHFNMGIAESNMVLFASGAARITKTPVFASSFAMFLAGRAWEMIRNSLVYDQLNVKLVATHAGISVGEDGGSHQMLEDIALMRSLPHLQIFCPADFTETCAIIQYVATTKEPSYVRLSREVVHDIFGDDYSFTPFQPLWMRQKDHSKVLIFSTGIMTAHVQKAIDIILEKTPTLLFDHIHIPSIKPLDLTSLSSRIGTYQSIITVEEHNILGGLGDVILGELATLKHAPVYKIGIQDQFGCSGTSSALMEYFQLDALSLSNRFLEYYPQ